jgi:hypothetical protein
LKCGKYGGGGVGSGQIFDVLTPMEGEQSAWNGGAGVTRSRWIVQFVVIVNSPTDSVRRIVEMICKGPDGCWIDVLRFAVVGDHETGVEVVVTHPSREKKSEGWSPRQAPQMHLHALRSFTAEDRSAEPTLGIAGRRGVIQFDCFLQGAGVTPAEAAAPFHGHLAPAQKEIRE